jgi:hypothetical protein
MLELIHTLLPAKERQMAEESILYQGIERRREERIPIKKSLTWDYFSLRDGSKKARFINLSAGGALIQVNRPIELRRWIRMAFPQLISAHGAEAPELTFTLAARVVRRSGPDRNGKWHVGIQFVQKVHPALLAQISELAHDQKSFS